MAGSRIKGITIEIDGDTTKLTTASKQVDKQIRDTQSSLRDVNKPQKPSALWRMPEARSTP